MHNYETNKYYVKQNNNTKRYEIFNKYPYLAPLGRYNNIEPLFEKSYKNLKDAKKWIKNQDD